MCICLGLLVCSSVFLYTLLNYWFFGEISEESALSQESVDNIFVLSCIQFQVGMQKFICILYFVVGYQVQTLHSVISRVRLAVDDEPLCLLSTTINGKWRCCNGIKITCLLFTFDSDVNDVDDLLSD